MVAAEFVCDCEAAMRNRDLWKPYPETEGPNQDGEVICSFCWQVLGVVNEADR